MITCRRGHLRFRRQRKSWGKIETEHFTYLPANFSHGVLKMFFCIRWATANFDIKICISQSMRKFHTLYEILLMVFEKIKLSVFNFAPYAKSHRVYESFTKPLWAFLKTTTLNLQIRINCEFSQDLWTQSSPCESISQTTLQNSTLQKTTLWNSTLRKTTLWNSTFEKFRHYESAIIMFAPLLTFSFRNHQPSAFSLFQFLSTKPISLSVANLLHLALNPHTQLIHAQLVSQLICVQLVLLEWGSNQQNL